MTEEATFDLEIASVTETDKRYFDGDGNETLKVLHTVFAKAKNGPRLTFQHTEPFPWQIGDPISVKVVTTQTHLDEYEEDGPDE